MSRFVSVAPVMYRNMSKRHCRPASQTLFIALQLRRNLMKTDADQYNRVCSKRKKHAFALLWLGVLANRHTAAACMIMSAPQNCIAASTVLLVASVSMSVRLH